MAQIESTILNGPFETRFIRYRWVGSPDEIVYVYRDIDIDRLPWPLHKIEFDIGMMAWKCVRTDSPYWRWINLYEAVVPKMEWLKWRIILTCYVWGFAEHEPGRIPEWSDIGWKRR